jgi:hypothetical protein
MAVHFEFVSKEQAISKWQQINGILSWLDGTIRSQSMASSSPMRSFRGPTALAAASACR